MMKQHLMQYTPVFCLPPALKVLSPVQHSAHTGTEHVYSSGIAAGRLVGGTQLAESHQYSFDQSQTGKDSVIQSGAWELQKLICADCVRLHPVIRHTWHMVS